MIIKTLEVRGNGASPFDDDNCSDLPTDTAAPTNTATSNATATGTNTPTPITLTPTATRTTTPTPTPVCSLGGDFSVLTFDTSVYVTEPDSISGGAYGYPVTAGDSFTVEIDLGNYYLTSRIDIYAYVQNVVSSRPDITVYLENDTSWVNSEYVTGAPGNYFYFDSPVFASRYVRYARIVVTDHDGVGIAGLSTLGLRILRCATAATVTPTQSATASQTSTITRTPTRTPTSTRTRIGIIIPSLTSTVNPSVTGTIASTPTPVPPTITRTSTRTNVPPPTQIATQATGTPVPSPTYMATITPGEPGDEDNGEIDIFNILGQIANFLTTGLAGIGVAISNFFAGLFNFLASGAVWLGSLLSGFIDWLASLGNWLMASGVNLGVLLSRLLGQIAGGAWLGAQAGTAFAEVLRIIALASALLSFVINVLFTLAGWVQQFLTLFNNLISAWFSAPPLPVPVLSTLQCVTIPYGSDICALWYILRNTVFSGQIGGLIIPVSTVVIDVMLVLRILKTIRNLLRKVEGITF